MHQLDFNKEIFISWGVAQRYSVAFSSFSLRISSLRLTKGYLSVCTFGNTFIKVFLSAKTYESEKNLILPKLLAARSKVWVWIRSLVGIAGTNPVGGVDICFLRVLCVVRWRSLQRAEPSSRRVLQYVYVSLSMVRSKNNPLHLQWICTEESE